MRRTDRATILSEHPNAQNAVEIYSLRSRVDHSITRILGSRLTGKGGSNDVNGDANGRFAAKHHISTLNRSPECGAIRKKRTLANGISCGIDFLRQ